MLYREFLEELKAAADENYRDFHKKLLKNDKIQVLGVRVPILRKIAKKYVGCIDTLLTFPDEFYEVTFVKLTAVSLLNYENFITYVDACVPLIDNWATCDCFTPKCVAKHKEDFLPYIERYAKSDGEFYQRFALTMLLHFYVESDYLGKLTEILSVVNLELYYVHMAAAWLVAEIAVKYYDEALKILQSGMLDKKTHNKAIQKACESFRLSDAQKNFLKGMRK